MLRKGEKKKAFDHLGSLLPRVKVGMKFGGRYSSRRVGDASSRFSDARLQSTYLLVVGEHGRLGGHGGQGGQGRVQLAGQGEDAEVVDGDGGESSVQGEDAAEDLVVRQARDGQSCGRNRDILVYCTYNKLLWFRMVKKLKQFLLPSSKLPLLVQYTTPAHPPTSCASVAPNSASMAAHLEKKAAATRTAAPSGQGLSRRRRKEKPRRRPRKNWKGKGKRNRLGFFCLFVCLLGFHPQRPILYVEGDGT